MEQINYGPLTCHAIGIIMKEMVHRAVRIINAKRLVLQFTSKPAYDGKPTDVVSDGDLDAQEMYVKLIKESFPCFGIIGEEKNLRVDCTDDTLEDMYFVVDPLDGTKAARRKQSHGIGTMIALIRDHKIISAFIGDILTLEIYGYRSESDQVHRITENGFSEVLTIDQTRPLNDQRLLLRKPPEHHSKLTKLFIQRAMKERLFEGYGMADGSIGISTARVWKSEVGATIFEGGYATPWDMDPIMGISQMLGFILLAPSETEGRFIEYPYHPSKTVTQNNPELLMIHRSRLDEFNEWQANFL